MANARPPAVFRQERLSRQFSLGFGERRYDCRHSKDYQLHVLGDARFGSAYLVEQDQLLPGLIRYEWLFLLLSDSSITMSNDLARQGGSVSPPFYNTRKIYGLCFTLEFTPHSLTTNPYMLHSCGNSISRFFFLGDTLKSFKLGPTSFI